MNELSVNDLKEHLERLERQHRRLKRFGGAVLIFFVGVALTAQAIPRTRTVEAERFVVIDSAGSIRAMLGTGVVLAEGRDSVGLRLFGHDGKTRMQILLRSNDDAPFIQLRDREEKVSAQLELSAEDTPGFNLRSARRGLRTPTAEMTVSFNDNGSPYIKLTDKSDKVLWKAP